MDPLAEALRAHVRDRAYWCDPTVGRLLDPDEARDRCQTETSAWMENLADFGVEATAVSGLRLDPTGTYPVAGHYAAAVGDYVWDWTARQFDPSAPVPLVTPLDEWRRRYAHVTLGWLDPLNGVCGCEHHRDKPRRREL